MSGECEKCGEHTLECSCQPTGSIPIECYWIDVKTKIPDPGKRVLATDGVWVEVMWYKSPGKWGSPSLTIVDITHWMELPEPPKNKK